MKQLLMDFSGARPWRLVRPGRGRKAAYLAGKKFGRWNVIEKLPARGAQHAIWSVICECGVRREIPSDDLLLGRSKSCGCWNREVSRARMTAINHRKSQE
jgi:hypothetical protein